MPTRPFNSLSPKNIIQFLVYNNQCIKPPINKDATSKKTEDNDGCYFIVSIYNMTLRRTKLGRKYRIQETNNDNMELLGKKKSHIKLKIKHVNISIFNHQLRRHPLRDNQCFA